MLGWANEILVAALSSKSGIPNFGFDPWILGGWGHPYIWRWCPNVNIINWNNFCKAVFA